MNESIKFTEDSPRGTYAKNDTGVMVAVYWTGFEGTTAVVRLSDESYVTAPLAHVEHVTAEDNNAES